MNEHRPTVDVLDEPALSAAYWKFVSEWRGGQRPSVGDALIGVELSGRKQLFPLLLSVDVVNRQRRGDQPQSHEYAEAHPEFRQEIEQFFARPSDSVSHSFNSTVSIASGDRAAVLRASDAQVPPVKAGRYQPQSLLGVGGFATVWRAHDPLLDRSVAVKVPRSDRHLTDEERRQMLTEAQRVSKLSLSGVVPVYDVVEESGQFYIVSKFIEGGTLAQRIAQDRLPPSEACRLVATIAETLHQAHLRNVVHRDIKPGNILLDEHWAPLISDFGLATSELEQRHEYHTVLGSYFYMSPEQARGDAHLVDARTDIYSLGMVLYELLTGRVAFLGETPNEILEQVIKREPRPLRTIDDSIPEELERICLKCLRKEVSQRYATAGDLAKELRAWELRAAQAPHRRTSPSGAIPPRFAYAGLVVLSIAALVLFWLWNGSRSQPGALKNMPSAEKPSSVKAEPLEAQVWRQRLGQDPQEIIWPGYHGQSLLAFQDDPRVLSISSLSPRLLKVGEIEENATFIAIGIKQPGWSGACGLFFGYREALRDGKKWATFQGLVISPEKNPEGGTRLHLYRKMYRISPDTGTVSSYKEFADQTLEWPAGDAPPRLELQISPAGISSGRWGTTKFSDAVCANANERTPRESYQGPWGLYHEYGTSWFQDPKVTPIDQP